VPTLRAQSGSEITILGTKPTTVMKGGILIKRPYKILLLIEQAAFECARTVRTDSYRRYGLAFFRILTLVCTLALLAMPRIPQDPAYHQFADQRAMMGIPNFLNVVSNIPLLLVGGVGLWLLLRRNSSESRISFGDERERWPCFALYFGVVLTGIGSGYYHLGPDNAGLVWDRLPMTVIFMSLLASVISERVSAKAGLLSLVPLLIVGGASVVYWYVTEQSGAGDLRPYAFVHFYPILPIFFILFFYPPRYTRSNDILRMVGWYALATVFELLDKQIFTLGGLASGHTVKHLLASMAVGQHLRMLLKRKRC